jgi:broad-specificity NMP kinase
MSYRSVSTTVEVYLDEFDDEVLIEELADRGYATQKEAINLLQEVIDWYKRGDVKEALIQLERVEPELFGISEKVK